MMSYQKFNRTIRAVGTGLLATFLASCASSFGRLNPGRYAYGDIQCDVFGEGERTIICQDGEGKTTVSIDDKLVYFTLPETGIATNYIVLHGVSAETVYIPYVSLSGNYGVVSSEDELAKNAEVRHREMLRFLRFFN